MSRIKPPFWILAATLLAFLPFIRRPLFVDDHAVFAQAKDLRTHLTHPYQTKPSKLGWTPGQEVGEDNPPVFFYTLALVIKLVGTEVWKSHVVLLLFHFAGLLSFYFLARRYVQHAPWATLIWLWTPHFYLTANGLLVDGMLASMMIMSLLFWIKSWESPGRLWLILAGLFLGLTPLVKYTGFLSWGLVVVWTFLEAREKKSWRWSIFLIPLALLTGWLFWTHHLYGQNHFTAVAKSRMTLPGLHNFESLALFLVGTTPCVFLPALASFSGHFQKIRLDRSSIFLLTWILLGFVGLAFALPWVCARFLVIIGPAVVLLVVRFVERHWSLAADSSFFRAATLILLAGFAFLLASADQGQAQVDEQVARQAEAWRLEKAPHQQAYYPEASLGGLSYYLPENQWVGMAPGTVLKRGDLLLLPWRTLPPAFFPQWKGATPVAQFIFQTVNPFRLLDFRTGAGFYGSIWGPFPFSLTRAPLEIYTLVKIQ